MLNYQTLSIGILIAALVPFANAGDLTLQAATEGQFQSPQIFNVVPGTRINALAKAWQVTPDAYRLGIAYERMSQKPEQERERSALLYRLPDMKLAYETEKSLKEQLHQFKITGRVLRVFKWDALGSHPKLNRKIQQGDVVYAPKRPNTITVGGVARAQTLPFKVNKTVGEYVDQIERLPGYKPSYVWVISPNTERYKVKIDYWNTEKAYIAPGSVIYVPLKSTLFHNYQEFNQSMLSLYAAQELPQ